MQETRLREVSGARALVEALAAEGIRHLFGVPGHGAYPIYDALNDVPTVTPVVGRNEQGAIFAADGYARVTEDVAVATSVPLAGVSNSLTGLWEANGHGSRLLYLLEHDPRHEALLRPVVRYYRAAFSPGEAARSARELIRLLRVQRPGVAVLEVPNGVLNTVAAVDPFDGGSDDPPNVPRRLIATAADLLGRAARPVICAGGYAWDARSARALTTLAEALDAPVLTGTMSKGAIPDDHRLALGLNYNVGGLAEPFLAEADVLLAIGPRAGMATGTRAPDYLARQLIHLDWDGAEQGPAYPARVAINGHLPTLLDALAAAIRPRRAALGWPSERREGIRAASRRNAEENIPWAVPFYDALRAAIPRDGLLFTDSLAGLWAFRLFPAYRPNSVHFPWFTGTLGHGIPAAVGAAVAQPDRPIVVLGGDGAFLYNSQELATMAYYHRKLIVVVANDHAYGAVRYNLTASFGRAIAYELANPDFERLGEAYGMASRRLDAVDQIGEAVRQAIASDRPTLIEVPLRLDPAHLYTVGWPLSKRVPFRVYVALVVAAILWGSLYPAAKPAVAAVGPMTVTLCRAALAALTLGVLALTRHGAGFVRHQAQRSWRGVLAIAALSFAGSSVLAMIALGLLPASVNGLLNNTHPLWVAIGSALLYPPRRPALLIGGSLVALLGVALVFFPDLSFGSVAGPNALNPLGVALSLAGSGVIAVSTAVGRKVMPGSDPITISALASTAAVPPLAALALVVGGFGPLLAATPSMLLLLLYLGVGCTAVNFSLWYYGLKQLPAARASAFQYLIPPLGVVFSALFLHEAIGVGLALGGAFIIVGLIATQLASRGTGDLKQPFPAARMIELK